MSRGWFEDEVCRVGWNVGLLLDGVMEIESVRLSHRVNLHRNANLGLLCIPQK